MKIQCSACEAAEAAVLCCADEAALCSDCDRNVHAANKLASKHERVALANSSSQMPNCDICQEMAGYFFCLEDRALMCRKCDVAIHTANPNVSSHSHQRLLVTGVRIGLEPSEPSPSSSTHKSPSAEKVSGMNTHSTSKTNAPMSESSIAKTSAPVPLSEEYTPAVTSFQQWLLDGFDGLDGQFNHVFQCADHGSSKADISKLGVSAFSSIARASEDNFNLEKCPGQEPDIAWSVPQVPTPPTTSGLNCTKTSQEPMDNSAFVPDIC